MVTAKQETWEKLERLKWGVKARQQWDELLSQVEPYKTPEGLYDVRAALEARVPLETLFPLFGEETVTNLMKLMSEVSPEVSPIAPFPPLPTIPTLPPSPYMVYDYETEQFVPVSEEEYLKREQFYQQHPEIAPPGTPEKITPEQFEIQQQQKIEELTTSLTPVFPELFAIEEDPSRLTGQIALYLQEDFQGFVDILYERVGELEADKILRQFGVSEDMILASLDFERQEEKMERTIQAVLPDFGTVEEFSELLERDPDLVIDVLKTIGRTPETENLLSMLGLTETQINEFYPELVPIIPAVAEVQNVITGEVIPQSELKIRYPMGSEAGLDEWVLTQETMKRLPSVGKVFWQALTKVPKQIGAAFLQAVQGWEGASAIDKDWADRVIAEAKTDQAKFVAEVSQKYGEAGLPFSPTEIAQLPQNLAFSITSMAAGLVTGVPIALLPVPGARVAAWTAGTIASGAVAYRMTTYQIMQEYLEAKNDEKIARTGSGLTKGEEDKFKNEFENLAMQYGLWEAVPEAISNLAFAKILTLPLSKMVGKALATRIVGKLSSLYGEELLTETITQKGQSAIEVEAGLRAKKITWLEAFKEVAPQTFLLTTIMGGAGQLSISSYNKIKESLHSEIGENKSLHTLIAGELKEGMQALITETEAQMPGKEIPKKAPIGKAEKDRLELVKKDKARIERGIEEGTIPKAVGNKQLESVNMEITNLEKQLLKVTPAPEVTAIAKRDKFLREQALTRNKALIDEEITKAGNREIGMRVAADRLQGQVDTRTGMPIEQNITDAQLIRKAATLPAIPKAETGMPEAGLQPSMIPEEIEGAEVVPPVEPPVPPTEVEVAPPPPEGSATARVFNRIQIEPAETGFTEKVRQGYHQFQVKMIDDLYSIKKFTEQGIKGGIELSIEENPYLLARLLRGIAGKANVFIENGTFGKQFWKIEKGKAVPNFTGESLENILKEVREPGAWQDFSTYLVARRSIELSARDIETGIELADAQSAIKELEIKHKNFPDLANRVYKYQDNLLVYSQEMGLLSQDLLDKLRKYGNYVPFYRVFNELQSKGLMGKKMANIANPIKKIKGSEREIINPLESIIKNTYVLISAADRNQVGIMMANLVDKNAELVDVFERVKTPIARVAGVTAKELGVEIEGLSETDAEAVIDIFRPSFFTRGDEVTVLIDGKKAYFRVDPDLRDGLLNLDRETMGLLGKFLSLPAKWLRAGATLSPDFMVRNPARDALTAFAYSNYNFLPGVDFMRGIAGIIRKDADYQLFRASGAEHSMLVSMDREYLHKTFNEVVQGKKFTDYVKHPLELFQIISELGEKATRLGEFKAGIRRGAIPLEAGYSARAVTLDFAQAGTTAHAVNRLIAFFNANIRGWGRMFSSFKEQPVRTSAKVFIGITLPSILLYFANRDDDRWKEIPQWQKDLFWIVMTKDNIYRIPKPFELGIIFGSMPERFLEWLDNKDPKLLKEVLANFAEAGSPGFIPTAILPIIENLTNYSFFRGRRIVPASREKMPPELQYTRWTSEVSKKLGELLKLSPAKIDNLINGWTGGLGRYAVDILDTLLKKTGISPDIPKPSPTLADIPVIKAFVVRNPYGSSGEAVESFYDILEKYEQGEKYLQEMLKLNEKEKFEKYKVDHPELLFFMDFEKETFYSASARYLRRVARDLSELGKKQDLIYKATDISPQEKRRLIDEIDILKTDLSRKALDLLIGKEPQLLQDNLNESIKRLGEVMEEIPVLSLEKPDIFDMRKLHTDFGNKLEAATKNDLDKLTNIDPLAYAYLEVKEIEKTIDPIVNKNIYEIMPDLKEGITFEDYYKAWQSGIIKDEILDNLTRRQVELLRKYHGFNKAEQKQFLKDNPELDINPREEWLKSHPAENAQLAVWGQAKLLTKEAYTEFKRLVKELDIPDSAIMTLPPEGSVDNYFKYQDIENKNSWEAQLMLAKDDELREFLGRQPIDTPIASLELKVKNREHYDAYQILETDEERRQYKLDNPDFVDDLRRIEAIEHDANDATIEAWVERGKVADEALGFNAEEKLWLVDHPEVHRWALDKKLLTDDGKDWNVSVLRIDVKYRKEDAEYDALPTAERPQYLEDNPDYRRDRRRREAYQKGISQVEDYVSYYELPVSGYRRERFLLENADFAQAMGLEIPERVPSEQYDILLEKEDRTPEDELRMAGYKLYVPDHFIEDYVSYKTLPSGTYEDDWFLMENINFYRDVYLGVLGNERKDFRLVPSRKVFGQYQDYLDTPVGIARLNYRWMLWSSGQTEFEEWLLLTGKVTEHIKDKKKQEEKKAAKKVKKKVEEEGGTWEERRKKIQEQLAGLR